MADDKTSLGLLTRGPLASETPAPQSGEAAKWDTDVNMQLLDQYIASLQSAIMLLGGGSGSTIDSGTF